MDILDIALLTGQKVRKKDAAIIENILTESTLWQRYANSIIGMIQYEDIPDGLDPTFLEIYRYCFGVCGVTKSDKHGIVAFVGGHSQDVDSYGLGTHFVGATPANETFDIVINETGVICKNNKLMTPDFDDVRLSTCLTLEAYKSIKACLKLSRYNKIVSTKDNKTQKALKEAMDNSEIGIPCSYVNNIGNELADEYNNSDDVKCIDLTDVRNSDKIQYLFKAIDDIERQFYRHYGISLANTSKMAQQSREELTNTNALAMIYALERLNCAKEFCDDLNRLYGTNMSCHFSEVWELEYQKYKREIEDLKKGDDENENTASDTIDNIDISEGTEDSGDTESTDTDDTERLD